jgi:hypothetical protein
MVRVRMSVSSVGYGKGSKSLDITLTRRQNWPHSLNPNPDRRAIFMA